MGSRADYRASRFACVTALLGAGVISSLNAATDGMRSTDGYLVRDVAVLVYPEDVGFESSDRAWTVRREVTLFEGYLWRYSGRRLSVNAHLSIIHRTLQAGEFRDYGRQFGFLLDRSPQVDADLRALGESASSVLLIYDPPPDRPNRIAGRTFFGGNHSSVPLSSRYFEGDGFLRPLHLVMVHEYLHQIDLAFSRVHHPAEFLDPDGVGEVDYPSCIDRAGADRSMRSLLVYNRSCQPISWNLLSPDSGTWIPR